MPRANRGCGVFIRALGLLGYVGRLFHSDRVGPADKLEDRAENDRGDTDNER